jgi:hypothetical protein
MRQLIAAAFLASLGLLSVGTLAKAALVTAKQPLACEVTRDSSWGEQLYLHNVGVRDSRRIGGGGRAAARRAA